MPKLGRKMKRSSRTAPLLANTRTRKEKVTPPRITTWKVTKPKTWDIGEGPWFWSGKRASRPEYITLIVLKKLGWRPKFQTDILGGRKIPGGQVLDIVIEDRPQPIYISVKSYYHEGAKAAARDRVKELIAKSIVNARVVEVWEKDIDQPGWLESYLRREIGVRGR